MMTDDLPRVPQLTRDDLRRMTHDQIAEAHAVGQLDEILGRTAPLDYDRISADAEDGGHFVTREELRALDPGEIVRLHSTGRLDHLLRPGDGA